MGTCCCAPAVPTGKPQEGQKAAPEGTWVSHRAQNGKPCSPSTGWPLSYEMEGRSQARAWEGVFRCLGRLERLLRPCRLGDVRELLLHPALGHSRCFGERHLCLFV